MIESDVKRANSGFVEVKINGGSLKEKKCFSIRQMALKNEINSTLCAPNFSNSTIPT